MKRIIMNSISIFLAVFAVIICFPFYASSEEKENTQEDYKVIFAIDTSGSMKYTDPDRIRSDAVGLFVGMLPEQNGSAGCLTFNTDVVSAIPLQSQSEKTNKDNIITTIQNSPVEGDTAIAVALKSALNMLDLKEGKPDPNSFIILLTDGQDDYSESGYTEEEYNKIRDEAVELAKSNGVTILTVAIDPSGSTDLSSLESLATDDSCAMRVSNSDDLIQSFKSIYKKCFPTCSPKHTTVSDNKESVSFFIPRAGITDTNIIVSSDETSTAIPFSRIEINDDSGKVIVTDKEIHDLTIKGDAVSVIKLPGKYTGECTVYLNGGTGSDDLSVVYNDCLNAKIIDMQDEYAVGNENRIKTQLYNHEEISSDKGYDDYTASLKIYSTNKETEPEELGSYNMSAQGDPWYEVLIPKSDFNAALYKIRVMIECKYTDKKLTTEFVDYNIVNAPTNNNLVFCILPFVIAIVFYLAILLAKQFIKKKRCYIIEVWKDDNHKRICMNRIIRIRFFVHFRSFGLGLSDCSRFCYDENGRVLLKSKDKMYEDGSDKPKQEIEIKVNGKKDISTKDSLFSLTIKVIDKNEVGN